MIKSGFYTIPAIESFADNLVDGLILNFPKPEQLAKIDLYLPSRRAISAVQAAFLNHYQQGAILLPRMFAVGEPEEDIFIDSGVDSLDLAEAINGFERQCLIAAQIQYFPIGGQLMSPAPAMRLSASLCSLIDQMQRAGTSLSSIKDILPEELSAHWQDILKFLTILFEYWPAILSEKGKIDPVERQQILLNRQLDLWRENPPDTPVILAGSNGTLPMTRAFMKVISQLPIGAVIFPGLDLEIAEIDWRAIEQDQVHPLHQIALSMIELDLPLSHVNYWHKTTLMGEQQARSRQILLREVMRPASRTSHWRALAVDQAELSPASLEGLKIMSVDDTFQEAELIAGLMRETLQTTHKTAMLITPDRVLARKVQAALMRWKIKIDDSAGTSLALSEPARFLLLLAQTVQEDASPHALRALFKHPFSTAGLKRAEFTRLASQFEEKILRGTLPEKSWNSWGRLVQTQGELKDFWENHLLLAFSPLRDAFKAINPSLDSLARALMETAEMMSALSEVATASEKDADTEQHAYIYSNIAGETLLELLSNMIRFGSSYSIAASAFANTLSVLCQNEVVRTPYDQHPRLKILGTIEARMQTADRIILGGLNEGIWPPYSEKDMWINNASRTQLGLPDRQWRIALSAHDFMMAVASKEVMITRSVVHDGSPSEPSRWLARLDAVVSATGLFDYLDNRLPDWMKAVTLRKIPLRVCPITRPEPKPAIMHRPNKITATDFDQWITDPYGFYVKRILKIRKNAPIDETPAAALRGSIIHDVIALFLKKYPSGKLPEVAALELQNILENQLSQWSKIAFINLFWRQKLTMVLSWFLDEELRRRSDDFQVLSEQDGKLEIQIGKRVILLTARADRIEWSNSDECQIIDYKSGAPPSKQMVIAGRAVQLLVEAVIASKGGYKNAKILPSHLQLHYWHLKGRATDPAIINNVTPDDFNSEAIYDLIVTLLTQFENSNQPYLSEPNAADRPRFSDVRHLARIKEWRPYEANDDG